MAPTLPAEEPAAGPWRPLHLDVLTARLLAAAGDPVGRPRIVAIDGRGAAGTTTLATAVAGRVPGAVVVHTDDLAWHEPLFGWGHLLVEHVLRPLHAGAALRFVPRQWVARGRAGAIEVPAGCPLVLVEGTGARQRGHAALIDASVWVQADLVEAERRGLARDTASGVNGDAEQAAAFWHHWMAAELPFLAAQRPWEDADLVVNGTPTAPLADDHVEAAGPLALS